QKRKTGVKAKKAVFPAFTRAGRPFRGLPPAFPSGEGFAAARRIPQQPPKQPMSRRASDLLLLGGSIPAAAAAHPSIICLAPSGRFRSFPQQGKTPVPGFPDAGVLSLRLGNDLLSRDLPVQVPSALEGLTAVFGMGTGGSPP